MRRIVFLCLCLSIMAASVYGAEYHVSVNGKDSNPGSVSAPLRTIQRGADIAQPGDSVTVHSGVYRERVNPPRGGESEKKRIIYQSVAGEKVEIKGSEVVKNWVKVENDAWKVILPNTFFGNFNPFNDLIRGDWFDPRKREHHTGAVYLNGAWLIETTNLEAVLMPQGMVPKSSDRSVLLNVAWLRFGVAETARRIPANSFITRQGTKNAPCSEGGECVGYISHGDWLKYGQVDLGASTQQIEVRAASASAGGKVEIRLNAPDGDLLGSCMVPNTGGWQSWGSFKIGIKPLGGLKTICLVFKGRNQDSLDAGLWYAKVDASSTTIWAQFKGVNPNEEQVEINARQTVFYPDKSGRNYITVRGFTMRHAATPWAPPTAEQIGLIGTDWSRGWIIENNVISHSVCSGIALGKHGDQFDNTSANSAEGYVKTIERAHAHAIPWTKENIGHHVVRNNVISHCEQTGIVGSLGCSFSTVTGNTIHDIHVRKLFGGAEMAGIKFHGAIDVVISRNHIFRTCRGLWLDWMAQGTRVTRNLFHDNDGQDLFMEVDHGPFLVDNNIFLSPVTLLSVSQGGAYVHNLIAGNINLHKFDARLTPFHKPHSTEVAGLHDNPKGDDRYYNNLFVQRGDMGRYDDAQMPVWMDGNVFLCGAKPSRYEKDPLIKQDFDPEIKLVEKADGIYLEGRFDKTWTSERTRRLVTTDLLGKAAIPALSYEQPDGSSIRINTDYFGKKRNRRNPAPGPFGQMDEGLFNVKVW